MSNRPLQFPPFSPAPFGQELLQVAVLIPAYNPDQRLPGFVRDLLQAGFGTIVVVDDGSHSRSHAILDELGAIPRCEVLRHDLNRGKGRALKTGLYHLYNVYADPLLAVLTADADGQHRIEDCVGVARAWLSRPQKLVLGSRQFSGSEPGRSHFGNTLTRHSFTLLTGHKLRDTQSGLRAIPRAIIPELLSLEGERYEFEMNVVISAAQIGLEVVEQPIEAVYIDGNASSHFRPIRDFARVYRVLGRFFIQTVLRSFRAPMKRREKASIP